MQALALLVAKLGKGAKQEYSKYMDTQKYETANSWFSSMREQGYEVPVTLLQTVENIMKTQKVGFSEAYKSIENRILVTGKVISFK